MMLAQQFIAYSEWRDQLSRSLSDFRRWLADNALCEEQTSLRFERLFEKLREDRLRVAFVAEFSRGKSELINAIFFSSHGNRMLPSTVGRTTMCPTELMYDPARPPGIDLLPIETREAGGGINDMKRQAAQWTSLPLDVDSPVALRETLRSVSEVIRVPRQTALRLGFPVDEIPSGENEEKEESEKNEEGENRETGESGGAEETVEIPRWRHAIINYPHPLLEQGLIILDTPGLNAIGAEPELTLSLLPSAHAILFILAADTGVTQSDLAVWNEHIGHVGKQTLGRLVVLNKIDGLWDGLKSEGQIAAEIDRQVRESARTLELPAERVFPVSAQKGLVAKVNRDGALLDRSQLPTLERALSDELIPAKQDIVRESTDTEFVDIHDQARGLLDARLAGLRGQIGELLEMRGKNRGIVKYMIGKIQGEKEEFETSLKRFYATRSVFSRLTNELFGHLGMDSLRQLTASTRKAMHEAATSRALGEGMNGFFDGARHRLRASEAAIAEILEMITGIQKKFVIEHGLRLSNPVSLPLARRYREIERLQQWCDTHLNTAFQLMTQDKQQVTQRFFDEVAYQVRRLFEEANRDAESWIKTLITPMEAQIGERQLQTRHRLDSIRRIHQTGDSLEERINEMQDSERQTLDKLREFDAAAESVRDVLRRSVMEESPSGVES